MPAAFQPLGCLRRTTKADVGMLQPALRCLHELRSLQRLHAIQATMFMLIAQAQAASMSSPFSALGTGLAAMGELAAEFGSRQVQVCFAEGLTAELMPALVQQGEGQFSPFGAARGMQHEWSRARPCRVVSADVVGHTMVFPQPAEQQARHA